MELTKNNAPSPDPSPDGSLPAQVTYDPTQGIGTQAWQLSLKHSAELNAAKQGRN